MRIGNFYHPVMVALAVLAGAGALTACGTSRGEEAHIATRCNDSGDQCWKVRCNDDGGNCYPVNYYYSPGDDRSTGHRYWVCNADRDNCHWVHSDPSDHDR